MLFGTGFIRTDDKGHNDGDDSIRDLLFTKRQIFFLLSKLKALAVSKMNVIQTFKFPLGRVENIVGKGENAGHQHFLLFPQCFQKTFFLFWVVKSRDCVVKS